MKGQNTAHTNHLIFILTTRQEDMGIYNRDRDDVHGRKHHHTLFFSDMT